MISNPQGIDLPIQTLQIQFLDHLFLGKKYSSNGRAFLNTREGVIPEVYVSANEYKEVLTDDRQDAISFFTVEPNQEVRLTEANAKVNIYFMVNLETLFTYSHRAVEEVHMLVSKEINRSPFQVTVLVTGTESVKEFTIENPDLLNMQPYYCFKFECSITYKLC